MDRYHHGDAAAYGPRKVGQWRTSSPRASCGRPCGYHHASRTTVASRPWPPHASAFVLVVREQAADVPRRAGLRLNERRDVEPTYAPGSPRTPPASCRPVSLQLKRAAWARPSGTSSSRRRIASSSAAPIASGSSGSARRAASPAASSSDGMRGRDDRDAGGHRLDDRDPEPLEPRRVDERRRAAVEPRELVVVDVAEADHVGTGRASAAAPSRPRRRRRARGLGERRGEQRLEVLPRLERRDGEHVRAARESARRRRREPGRRPGTRPRPSRAGTPSSSTTSPLGELGVDEDHVAGARGVPVLGAVHPLRPALHPLGEAQRHEVVDHRRADPAALRRVHPVDEVEHVDRPEEALDRRPPGAAPALPPEVREREEAQPRLDRDPGQRLGDAPLALRARRREGDDLVLRRPPPRRARAASRGCSSRPGARVGQRRDVEGDAHGS